MPTCRPLAAAFATAILAFSSAASSPAQQPTTQRQPLEPGQERTGVLSAKDSAPGSRHAQSWALRGRRGQPVVVDLISTEFDPELMIVGPGMAPHTDDDGGGACNARVAFTPSEDGIFWMVVEATDASGSGTFTLRASRTAAPLATGECGSQESPRFGDEDLAAVPVAGALTLGDSVIATLSRADHALGDGHARAYELGGKRGASATIDLRSGDFDAYLAIIGPGLARALADDDSGGGCDARLTLVFPADGTYRLIVTSASASETGGFVLKAGATGTAVEEHDCADSDHEDGRISPDELLQLAVQGTLQVGDDVPGELKRDTPNLVDGTHALAWTIAGTKGQTVVVDLVSEAFDGFLLVTGPQMSDPITDDDSGGACNPRLTLTFPTDGTYRIVANSVERGAIGAFHLKVSAVAGPEATGSCGGGQTR